MIRIVCLALLGALFSHTAYAERACCVPKPKWYMGLGAGMVFLEDTDLEETIPTGLTQGIQHDMGMNVSGQFGYRVFSSLRVELEGIYFRNSVDEYVGGALEPGKYRTTTLALMANSYYDFLQSYEVNPYVGAGVGFANVTTPIIRIIDDESQRLEDKYLLAYQFMAGANFPVPDSPFYFSIGYRYFTTGDAEVSYGSTPGYNVKFDNTSHNIELGGKLYF